jgi:hypothetical protein
MSLVAKSSAVLIPFQRIFVAAIWYTIHYMSSMGHLTHSGCHAGQPGGERVPAILQAFQHGVNGHESGYNPVGVYRCFPLNGCG